MSGDPLLEADVVVDRLRHAMGEGEAGLKHFPGLLKRALREGSWRERVIAKTGKAVQFESFVEFVETDPLDGLGASLRVVENLIRDDAEAKDLLDKTVYNITRRRSGTAPEAALRKLRKDRPDLHAHVLAGDLSPHAAMLEAGFRRRTATIYVDTPQAALQALLRRFTHNQLRDALDELE